jgi:hypothetical protein
MLLGWISAHVRDETPDPIADALASTSTQINEASGHYVQ